MRWLAVFVAVTSLLCSGACSKKAPAPAQQATVLLKDGTSFAGTVTKNTSSEITLTAPTGEARTYPMSQVSSIQYGTQAATAPPPDSAQTSPPPSSASTPQPVPASGQPVAASSPPPGPAPEQPAPTAAVAPEPPPVIIRTVPAGTEIVVRNNDTIDSSTAASGQPFSAVLDRDVLDTHGEPLIHKGARATLILRSAEAQGKMQGQSELVLALANVVVAGKRYDVAADAISQKGKAGVGKNKRTAGFIGGGTAFGAIIGGVAGGGKGAAIGALSGAAAGTATQALTRGKGVKIPSETVLTFHLQAPLKVQIEG